MNQTDFDPKPAAYEVRQVSQLQNWDENPRTITDKEFERLKEHIKRLGMYKPLLINQSNIVLGGNMRLRALKDMGIQEVMCAVVLTDNKAQMIEYALSDNDQMGATDEDKIAELVTLNPIKTELFAVSLGKLKPIQTIINEHSPDAEEPDTPPIDAKPAVSQLGEIYQLGRHRLMCGDSTDLGAVSDLMDGKLADMIFTDPPYNVDYEGKTKEALKIQNDTMSDEKFYQFLLDAHTNMAMVTKDGGAIYVCHADSEGLNFRNAFVNAGYSLKQCIIWVKQSMVMGRQDYQWQHEPILYGWKPGAAHYFVGDRTQTTVWPIDRPSRSEDHPTMKPIELCAKAIRNSSLENEIVLDLFGGSGSTLMACEATDRVSYTMELDPKYCDVIRKRWWMAGHDGNVEGWEEGTKAV